MPRIPRNIAEAKEAAAERHVRALSEADTKVVGADELRERNGQPTALVRADGRTGTHGRSPDDLAFANAIKLAQHAENHRADIHATVDCLTLEVGIRRHLDDALDIEGRRDLVPEATIRALAKANTDLADKLDAWLLQRGLTDTDAES